MQVAWEFVCDLKQILAVSTGKTVIVFMYIVREAVYIVYHSAVIAVPSHLFYVMWDWMVKSPPFDLAFKGKDSRERYENLNESCAVQPQSILYMSSKGRRVTYSCLHILAYNSCI